jgi:hypothetical protein
LFLVTMSWMGQIGVLIGAVTGEIGILIGAVTGPIFLGAQ